MESNQILLLIQRLAEKTSTGDCVWENDGRGFNRLILSNGSIVFEYSYDDMVENYHYAMKLYDTTEQFASFFVDYEDNYDETLFRSMEMLRESIETRRSQVMDAKIKLLYDELK